MTRDRGRGIAAGVRAATGASGVLLLRRARVDLALLLVLGVVLALVAACASIAPGVASGVIDAGARDAVTRAGSDADLLVDAPVGRPMAGASVITPRTALGLQRSVGAGLPEPIRRLAGRPTGVVVGPPTSATAEGGAGLLLRIGVVDPGVRLRVVAGRLPRAAGTAPVEAVLGRDAARTASIAIGDRIRYPSSVGPDVELRVVGLVEPRDAVARRVALDLPGLWKATPVLQSAAAGGFEVSALTTPEGALAAASAGDGDAWTGRVRVPFVGDRFTAALVPRVADAVETLAYLSGSLGDVPVDLRVESGFRPALEPFEDARGTAAAQLALALTGAVAVALAVAVLLMRLLVRRRRASVLLQRSRGASVAAVAVGALVEALVVSALAALVGIGAASLLLGRVDVEAALLVLAVAAPVQVVLAAVDAARVLRRTGTARAARGGGRAIAEATVGLLAVGAVLAVRARGLQPSAARGLDPLLVATPVLAAAAAALVAIRVHPVVVRGAARLAARRRGALGLIATAHAERSLTALPLAVLALAVGVAVGGVLLTDAVRRSQADASWQIVGADAHLTGTLPAGAEAALDAAPGVTAAAVGAQDLVELTGENTKDLATLLAVDDRYSALLARLPGGLTAREGRALRRLEPVPGVGAAVPALVSSDLADRSAGGPLELQLGARTVPLRVVGTLDRQPGGFGAPPTVTVPRAALLRASGGAGAAPDLLAVGPGAEAAARAIARAGTHVETRTGWRAEQQRRPLVGGVTAVTAVAAGVAEGFALVALVAEVVAGATRRRRVAALLASVGVRGRVARSLLLTEVAPVALGALLAGLVAGGTVAFLVGPVLRLDALTAGAAVVPAFSVPVLAVALLGVLPAVLIAIAAETITARRIRPASDLRTGDGA